MGTLLVSSSQERLLHHLHSVAFTDFSGRSDHHHGVDSSPLPISRCGSGGEGRPLKPSMPHLASCRWCAPRPQGHHRLSRSRQESRRHPDGAAQLSHRPQVPHPPLWWLCDPRLCHELGPIYQPDNAQHGRLRQLCGAQLFDDDFVHQVRLPSRFAATHCEDCRRVGSSRSILHLRLPVCPRVHRGRELPVNLRICSRRLDQRARHHWPLPPAKHHHQRYFQSAQPFVLVHFPFHSRYHQCLDQWQCHPGSPRCKERNGQHVALGYRNVLHPHPCPCRSHHAYSGHRHAQE